MATLVLELVVITMAPSFWWLIDAPYLAGTTFISEYSLIILLRWMVILTFQYQLFSYILNLAFGLATFVINTLRKVAPISNDHPSVMGSIDLQSEKRPVGRPKKH